MSGFAEKELAAYKAAMKEGNHAFALTCLKAFILYTIQETPPKESTEGEKD